MNAKEQIKMHVEKQIITMEDWTGAKPQIKAKILAQDKKIRDLEAEIRDLKIMFSRLEYQLRQPKKRFMQF